MTKPKRDAPARLVRYRGKLCIYNLSNGQKTRVSTGTNDPELARETLRHWVALNSKPPETVVGSAVRKWLKARLRTAAQNGPRRGQTCDLTLDDMEAMYVRSGGKCEVSGIQFDLSPIVTNERNPYRISLDRIESKSPYTVANCRLVCVAVNYAMGAWGEKTLREIAVSMAAKSAQDATFIARRLSRSAIRSDNIALGPPNGGRPIPLLPFPVPMPFDDGE